MKISTIMTSYVPIHVWPSWWARQIRKEKGFESRDRGKALAGKSTLNRLELNSLYHPNPLVFTNTFRFVY